MIERKSPAIRLAIGAVLALSWSSATTAQQPITTQDSTTITYPAAYFSQFQPFSVNDMLARIPGITVAQGGGSAQGGPGSSGGNDRRGLGSGADQVLINGRRIAGKENEGNQQLARIPASQVQYIEIIRGTSGDLDVRGGSQVINVVLVEAESRSSVAYEMNMDHYHHGKNQPGGKVSLTGQSGALSYFLSAEKEPRWEFRDGFEVSTHADGSPNDTVDRDDTRDSWPITLVSNLGYEFTPSDTAHLNLQWSDADAPTFTDRTITDFNTSPATVTFERDDIPSTNGAWEIGGDYEHGFANGHRFRTLFIVNEAEDNSRRETFVGRDANRVKDLYLANYARNRERIVRSSYNMNLFNAQALEIGVERAQTLLDTALQLGLDINGQTDNAFGGLVPVTDAHGRVEEMRYEYFAIHNLQINPRMSLETTLLFEDSTITQSGDISKSRDFNFFRPKIDYRFDITPSLQFRASVAKDVAQLSFADFTANVAGGDDDQNALAGNPDLRQEQSVRYETNLEYRLPNDLGVLNTNVFYHALDDVIERVDVSTQTRIQSANGNIGSGKRFGINIDGSLRLSMLNQPGMLLTARVALEDSSVTDPFVGIDRRLARRGRGNLRLGYRHDLASARNMNYGFNYSYNLDGGVLVYDIDKIEEYPQTDSLTMWFETVGWNSLTYRFESMNTTNAERCRIRSRYVAGTIATGRLNEVENSCSITGIKYAIKVRGTF